MIENHGKDQMIEVLLYSVQACNLIQFVFNFLQLKDFLRCFKAVEHLSAVCDDKNVKVVLRKWTMIKEFVDVLSIPSEITTCVQSPVLTLSDLYGALLRMEYKLKKTQEMKQQKTNLAKDLMHNFLERRKTLIETPAMKVAIYLDPRYSLQLSADEIKIAKHTIERYYTIWKEKMVESGEPSKDSSFEEYLETKKRRPNASSSETDDSINLSLLLETYEKTMPNMNYKESILRYWESRKEVDPILYAMACIIYTVAPTQVAVERTFSILGLVYNHRRTRLHPELLENLLMINLNKTMVPVINERDLKRIENDFDHIF